MRYSFARIGMVGVMAMLIITAFSAAVPVAEAQLPKSGTGSIHSGYKGTGEMTEVGDKHLYWVGTFWGMSFNDTGTGFLHEMAWNCPAVSEVNQGIMYNKGLCELTDADGDKIHGSWSNEGPPEVEIVGPFEITSGTGKYAGIQGGWEIRCSFITPDQAYCRQKYNYKLP